MSAFLNAVRFLTIIPVPGGGQMEPGKMGRSVAFFPLVGLLLGLITAGLNWLIGRFLPASVTAILLVLAMTVLTGGLHLDGLMDTCDGVFVRRTPEERLRIMDDSRVGSFGVIGGALVILSKYAVLTSLPGTRIFEVLVLTPVVSRFLMAWAVFAFPCARPEGLGFMFKQSVNVLSFAVATVTALAIIFIAAGLPGLAITAAVWIIITLAALYLKSRLNGLTGDTYGALNELAEVAVLIILSALSMAHPASL
jgi:adenosylcobinamide-GDP ribazoletransferase